MISVDVIETLKAPHFIISWEIFSVETLLPDWITIFVT